jgi:hypothetical protein
LYTAQFHVPSTSVLDPLPSNPPRPQRQRLYSHHRRLNIHPECHYPNHNAQHVGNVVSVRRDVADASSFDTSMLFSFKSAGKRLRDEGSLQTSLERIGRWDASRRGEHVDSLEYKVAWKCSTKVRDSGLLLITNTSGVTRRAELTWREESCMYRQSAGLRSLHGRR